ncbi:hypothetical protein RN01_29930 [Cupriavidus sp. SHE]|uniref:hypothetical protein n=1 Tax=Cupriavidus TaxID=106589 RepID=UPI00046B6A0E|nr:MULTISPECIES: hypothetical protein [Cupriavidus]KWR75334.1 hypothetical protein RN01_29930 [Cupriavidus sp. SHE]
MTALLAILAKIWPFLLTAGGIIFGMFRHQQAAKTEAQAKQREAEADAQVAQANAVLAKANEDAARAGADNAKVRRDEDAAVAGEPDANRVLHDEWGK